jgi:trigger factor
MSDKPDIQVETTEQGDVVRELRIQVPAPRVRRSFDRIYRELAREVSLPGFRRGKAPRSVLERRYGATVAEEVQRALVGETLASALEQLDRTPVGEPAIDAPAPQPGASFEYTARVEVTPEIELPDLAGLPGRQPRVQVEDEEVTAELERLQQHHAPVVEEPEGTAIEAADHILSLDFVGRIDGEPFEGGSGRDVELEMGSGRFPPGFEEQLVGARSGEDREVRITFPEDFSREELRGKEAVFQVHVGAVKRRQLPALDDEFAVDLGEESLEALRDRIRGQMHEMRERAAREELHRTLVDALIERAPFAVPPSLVERQRDRRLAAARRRLEGAVPSDALESQLEQWREAWRADAEREVRETLLLEAVARQEGLEASAQDVEARITRIAAEQGVEAAQLRRALGDEAVEAGVRRQLVEEKALEFLRARAKVEETTGT